MRYLADRSRWRAARVSLFVTMARSTRRPGNLPAEASSFIGRRHELAELRKKLAGARLVCLAGPGGVGKTRLAVRGATDLARGFAGGAWMVELAQVQDPALVGNAVMGALDLRDQTATEPLPLLRSYLQDKELLLVVDNCEHLLAAAAQLVTEVIRAAPGVRVIATSREPLSVSGEHVVPVPPLELPATVAAEPEPLSRLRQNEAVLLFTERAVAASGNFELTASNQAAVVDLCRRLDGLPLAIELAAVRTRVLTAEQILDRLTDRFSLLTGGSRAGAPQAVRRVRGQVHPGGRRVGLYVRRRARGTRIGPAVIACRQVPGSARGRQGPRLLSAARDDGRIHPPQAPGGRRGGPCRTAMRRLLRLQVSASCRATSPV